MVPGEDVCVYDLMETAQIFLARHNAPQLGELSMFEAMHMRKKLDEEKEEDKRAEREKKQLDQSRLDERHMGELIRHAVQEKQLRRVREQSTKATLLKELGGLGLVSEEGGSGDGNGNGNGSGGENENGGDGSGTSSDDEFNESFSDDDDDDDSDDSDVDDLMGMGMSGGWSRYRNDFKELGFLGEGGFGAVVKAR